MDLHGLILRFLVEKIGTPGPAKHSINELFINNIEYTYTPSDIKHGIAWLVKQGLIDAHETEYNWLGQSGPGNSVPTLENRPIHATITPAGIKFYNDTYSIK